MCHIMAQVGSAVERGQTQKSQGGNHPGFFCELLARGLACASLSEPFSEKSADLPDAGPDCHGDRHAHHHAHLRG